MRRLLWTVAILEGLRVKLRLQCSIPHHSIILPEILFLTHLLPSVHTSLSLSGIRDCSFKLVYLTPFTFFFRRIFTSATRSPQVNG
jgi:hypothetical protein